MSHNDNVFHCPFHFYCSSFFKFIQNWSTVIIYSLQQNVSNEMLTFFTFILLTLKSIFIFFLFSIKIFDRKNHNCASIALLLIRILPYGRPVQIKSWISSLVSNPILDWALDFYPRLDSRPVKIQDSIQDLIKIKEIREGLKNKTFSLWERFFTLRNWKNKTCVDATPILRKIRNWKDKTYSSY